MSELAGAQKRRVATFYRVSTKGQLDGDDIPMQRRACMDFIERQGWQLVKEYIEKGISGFKVSAVKRDEIQRAKADAEMKAYDILLVFMFDRLGRRDDETPFVMKWFSKKGVELWSAKEGQQKFEDHSDDLINYIRFWQSSGESKKTSMRVNEKHTQMVEDGVYRGGTPPYGYRLVEAGIKNKKGKELYRLEVNEEQIATVKFIYNSVFELGHGSNRITQALNRLGIRTSMGSQWVTGAVNYILRNPVYKGYMVYGKRKSDTGIFTTQSPDKWILSREPLPQLIIIEEEIWNKVQEIRSSRAPEKVKDPDALRFRVSKSPLLFVGLARCGHCDNPLTTTYNTKTHRLKDGTVRKYTFAKYRCSGKALGKSCEGQTIHAQSRIEPVVLKEVYNYLDRFNEMDVSKEVNELIRQSLKEDEQRLKTLTKEKEAAAAELNALNAEVVKSLMGKSNFKPELLGSLIAQKETDLRELATKLSSLEGKVTSRQTEMNDLFLVKKHVPVWREVFETASFERKKMMVHSLISKVQVFRDRMEIAVRLHVGQFLDGVRGKGEQTSETMIKDERSGREYRMEQEIVVRK